MSNSGDATSAVHTALITALKANSAVSALVAGRVFEWAQESEPYPQIAIGDYVSEPWDTDSAVGTDLEITVHTWATGDNGRIVARQIGEAVSTRLHRNALAVTDFTVVTIQRTVATVVRDDANMAHGIFRFRVLLEYTGVDTATANALTWATEQLMWGTDALTWENGGAIVVPTNGVTWVAEALAWGTETLIWS